MKDSVDEDAKLKVLASILRAGGWVLEKALAPLSKSAANKIKKYRLKIADGLEKAEKTTESGISKGLQKAGRYCQEFCVTFNRISQIMLYSVIKSFISSDPLTHLQIYGRSFSCSPTPHTVTIMMIF
ncbi:hypothetical protein [Aeribacillus pallidus]|uniref:Uncharacterized protein n=1 Tax=Aeribacillus pallidus TaxID=33936 RepID=A0A223E5A6_9BACI|nr:hypothetical protein [Aeribacillus pallidus]ASS90448.1 hypothetical protein AP3564_09675 [Aeribacillus pallidus]